MLHTSDMPKDFTIARIILLPKPGRDFTNVASYRPISLLNTDYKVLGKVFAERLKLILPKIISPGQIGFVQNRYSVQNIRNLIATVVKYRDFPHHTAAAISLDAEKAFDGVTWLHLLMTLANQKFGPGFINFIRTIYKAPQAIISTQGINSEPFIVHKGTKHGCPYHHCFSTWQLTHCYDI